MGVKVADEHPYELRRCRRRQAGRTARSGSTISGCGPRRRPGGSDPRGDGKEQFEQALCALWRGEIEDDGFNALVLDAGLAWRDRSWCCARTPATCARPGNRSARATSQRVLRSNTTVDPAARRGSSSRASTRPSHGGEAERSEAIVEEIRGELDDVVSLDQDRILRSYLALIGATLRTNYYPAAGGAGAAAPRRYALPGDQARPGPVPEPARAAAEVRDLRVLAPARGRAPALRPGRARRAALVRPARGLPHRGARAWSRRRR